MPYYYIWTIGCQMNKAETERLGGHLEGRGYLPTANAGEADIIILNTCVVRQSAENRAVNRLNALKTLKTAKHHPTIAVTGCLVNPEVDHLRRAFPHVDYFFPPGAPPPWLEQGESIGLPAHPQPSTYVPIIQGCDNFCTYCIVPYRRGRERSRPVPEILAEVEELASRGVKEVTLLGQNVDSYGHDLPDRLELADLLHRLNQVDGLSRIRFLTNHPKDMSPRLIEAVASLDKVCEQISLPVQSGSDDILRAMRRGYSVEHYRRLVAEIRHQIPGVGLSTDVIVGFPSESRAQFQQTFDLLAELRFDTVHVAAYSPRPGTLAASNLDDDVPQEEKKNRFNLIEELQAKIAGEINNSLLGETVEVLLEGRNKDKWHGRTRTGKLVFISTTGHCPGQVITARIKQASPWSLQGRPETKGTK